MWKFAVEVRSGDGVHEGPPIHRHYDGQSLLDAMSTGLANLDVLVMEAIGEGVLLQDAITIRMTFNQGVPRKKLLETYQRSVAELATIVKVLDEAPFLAADAEYAELDAVVSEVKEQRIVKDASSSSRKAAKGTVGHE